MNFFRQRLPLLIAFVVGVVMVAQYYVPNHLSQRVGARAADGYTIIKGMLIFLGAASLLHLHGRKITRQEAGWGYRALVFLGFVFMFGAGIRSRGQLTTGEPFRWGYDYLMVPLSATLFSILAFFIASAAYRAFRARSLDATLLLVTALVFMFCRVRWGESLLALVLPKEAASEIVAWFLEVPNAAANRGILIGVALGMIATSVKVILGIERAYLGDSE